VKEKSRIVASIFLSGCFLFVLTAMSGASIFDSTKLAIFIALQISGGAALWYVINDYRPIGTPEAIGMGLAIGSSITTLSQTLFRETFISQFSWTILFLCLVPFFRNSEKMAQAKDSARIIEEKNETFSSISNIFALSMLALSTNWWWLYPLTIAIFSISTLNYLSSKYTTNQTKIKRTYVPILFIGFMISLHLSSRNDFWIVMSNDQVFSESLSWSTFKWGNNDSPFVAGTPINYHWFVLLWSGITSSVTNAESWIVITRVLPIVSFLGISALIWTITKNIYGKLSAPIIAMFFLILYSNNFGGTFTKYIVSPTFLLSCVWLLAFANSVFSFYRKPSLKFAMLSVCLLFVTFGGKVTNGAVGISALLFALTIWFFKKDNQTNRFKILCLALASMTSVALIYLFMYTKDQPGNGNTLTIGGNLPLQFGLLQQEKGWIYQLLVNLFLFISMMLPLAAIGVYSVKRKLRSKFEVWFILGSMISGLLLSFATSHSGASQLYFWLSSLVLAAILIPAVIYDGFEPKNTLVVLFPIALLSLFASRISSTLWRSSETLGVSFENIKVKSFALLVGLLTIALFTTFLYLFFKHARDVSVSYAHMLLCGLFVFFNLSIGFNQHAANVVTRSQIKMSDPSNHDLITGSNDHLEVLSWIRSNTNELDVVATNRFCIPGPGACVSKWQLVSAISHRRMLFEGGYYVLPNIPDQEMLNRYILSSEFALNPSAIGLNRMCQYGVRWYFFDHAVASPLRSWEPYAAIKLQNRSVSLLELNCLTK
jgi:hypothetical protein